MKTSQLSIAHYLTDPVWNEVLSEQLYAPYFESINKFIHQRITEGAVVYPELHNIFNAFNLTPFNKVKVVIIGQDPYHGEHQAHGLCFSVNNGIPLPPSLKNIYKELHADLQIPIAANGNLEAWAQQGVLLMNATLTVENGKPGSHQGIGWEIFTDSVINMLSNQKSHLVFLLWGKFAQAKSVLIDESKHTILKAAHPSPLSAYNGFFGCKHFSRTNNILKSHGLEPINWNLNKE